MFNCKTIIYNNSIQRIDDMILHKFTSLCSGYFDKHFMNNCKFNRKHV